MGRSESCGILLLFLPLLLLPAAAFPSFAVEPQDVVAVVNGTATLYCRILNKTSEEVSWTRNGSALSIDRFTFGCKSCYITGDPQEGDFNLFISPVNSFDKGIYQCTTAGTPDKLHPEIHSRIANLTVLIPPESTNISNGDIMENSETTVAYGSDNGKATSKVVGTNVNFTEKVDNKTFGQYNSRKEDLAGLEVIFGASPLIDKKPVIYSDTVQFGILGKAVNLICLIHSATEPNYVIWSYNGSQIDASDEEYTISEDYFPQGIKSTLVIKESNPSQFNSYNCSVSNAFGSDSSIILLKELRPFPWFFIIIIMGIFITISTATYLYLKQKFEEYIREMETVSSDGSQRVTNDFWVEYTCNSDCDSIENLI